jgi:hypothetical protein
MVAATAPMAALARTTKAKLDLSNGAFVWSPTRAKRKTEKTAVAADPIHAPIHRYRKAPDRATKGRAARIDRFVPANVHAIPNVRRMSRPNPTAPIRLVSWTERGPRAQPHVASVPMATAETMTQATVSVERSGHGLIIAMAMAPAMTPAMRSARRGFSASLSGIGVITRPY